MMKKRKRKDRTYEEKMHRYTASAVIALVLGVALQLLFQV